MTSYELAERRLLVALWIDHHGPERFLEASDLQANYNVVIAPKMLEGMAARLKKRGLVNVHHDKDGVGLVLTAEGYPDGLAAALEMTGGSELNVYFAQKELLGDGEFPADMPGSPGWKYMEFEPKTSASKSKASAPTRPSPAHSSDPIEREFLVASYHVTEGNTRQRLEARALTKRVDFGDHPSGWIIEIVKELGSLGMIAPTGRDGGDEDQFIQMTDVGIERARRYIDDGQTVRWRPGYGGGSSSIAPPGSDPDVVFSLDHSDEDYKRIETSLTEVIEHVKGDNNLPNQAAAVARLQLCKALWEQAKIKIDDYKIGIFMTVDDVCEQAVDAYYKGALVALLAMIKAFAKDKLKIEL